MVNIGGEIYCVETQLNMAHSCGEGTVMIRILMDGILKKNELLHCTYSGHQPPRNLGKSNEPKVYRALHSKAKVVIIKYTLEYAKSQGWKKKTKHDSAPYKWIDLQQTMTQKIGEIKRAYQKNLDMKK
ncbi:uncharacterized protein LOC112456783 [Temnothorax curvispinosus]|uniref:Uncharacterized protein LOC112456783 n=1 Tax=Temnothorax curvispinosus TaxID=300111 RepID=A0A6J1Q0U0_9HYME|nr:uncharacterized protein LOC112456783 [Temnothorax curvispinosus]